MKIVFTLLGLFFCFATSQAQILGGGAEPASVTWKTTAEPQAPFKNGQIVTVTFEATIADGYYVYSTVPPAKQANLPSELLLAKGAKGVKFEGKVAESGNLTKEYDSVFETDVRYYKKKMILTQKFKIGAENATIEGEIKYQVCDKMGRCVLNTLPFKFH